MNRLRRCRECKKRKSLRSFSLDRGKPRRICKKCASDKQSERYAGQGAAGRKRVLKNWNAFFRRDPARARFNLSKSAAKQSGHQWQLTLEQYRRLNALPCYYCGGVLPEKGRGLDRKNNAEGYTLRNVLPCCTVCNTLRSDNFTVEETKVAVDAIQQLRKQKGLSK
jgi:hypothetical protein